MADPLVSVIESASYLAAARKLLSAAERESVVDLLAADPECGDVIRGGGGIRKVRIPLAGRGKSGGARVIYYFHSVAIPAVADHRLRQERESGFIGCRCRDAEQGGQGLCERVEQVIR